MYVEIKACGRNFININQVHIRKVKLLKSPKFDLGALLNLHGESNTDEQGQKVEREFKEKVLDEV
jgi:small subunit ribosomal protein S3Ae